MASVAERTTRSPMVPMVMAFQGTFTNAQGAVETCTRCQLSIGTQSGTRKHLKRGKCKIAEGCGVLENDVDSENGEVEEGSASNSESQTKKAKLRLETELAAAQQQIVKDTTKILPLEMVKFVTAAMDITPFLISKNHAIAGTRFTVFLERNYAPLLSTMILPGFSITHLDLDSSSRHLSPKDGYEEIGRDHMPAVDSGGPAGLERLSGTLIETGSKIAELLIAVPLASPQDRRARSTRRSAQIGRNKRILFERGWGPNTFSAFPSRIHT